MLACSVASRGPPAGCLQLRLRRRPGPLLVHLLLSSPARLRIRLQATPEPPADSFAGWSPKPEGGDDDDKAPPESQGLGGLLGAGLAGFFFVAALGFAAFSFRANNHANGTRLQMQTLPRDAAATETLSDDVQDTQDSSPSNSPDDEKHANQFLVPLEANEQAAEHETARPLQTDDIIVTEEAHQFDNLIASDSTEGPPSAPPLPSLPESAQVAFQSSSEPDAAHPSEGTPNLEDSKMTSPENQHLDQTAASDVMVLDSEDVVPIQEISNSAVETASQPKDSGIEQNPETYNNNETSASRLPDYIEYQSASQMLPVSLNDLPIESNKPEKGEETSAADLNEGQTELENQNELSKSTEPDPYFSPAGIPAPCLLSTSLQVPAGQIVIPATIDPTQENALAALQILKVIEPGAQAGDLCTRREYARWLVVASNCLSRNTYSKVYPAMYIDNVTELAFDDVTPEDPDFPFIQGLAEAGLISSKLSKSDMNTPEDIQNNQNLFSPESPLSRQDLVSWKMALDKRQLPEIDRDSFFKASGYIDIDKINAAAWPALAADLHAGDQSITALAFGFTRLFQPDKPVTKGQAALAVSTGASAEVVMEELARIEAEKIAEAAVNAHGALVAQVEKDINGSFERELTKEREKVETLEKLAEEARMELDRLRAEREEEKTTLIRGRAAVESEMEVLSKLRSEVEEQLQSVLSKKVEISFEKNRIEKLQKEIENENLAVVQLQYELEVERKALSMARAWAEEEAKKAREHARALEEARNQWERQGIKVVVEGGFEDDASAGVTWANAGKEHPMDEAINRAESLLEKLKSMSTEMKIRSRGALERVMQQLRSFIATLKQRAAEARQRCTQFGSVAASKANKLSAEAQGSVRTFGLTIGDKSKRLIEDCKEGLDKFAHRFKTD
ncbi:hypothetical protein ACP70R_023715 [Stipagrostis hirtigluma subsp. patula]